MDLATDRDLRMVVENTVLDILVDILHRPKTEIRMLDHLHRDLRMDSDDFSFLFVPLVSKKLGVNVPAQEWNATDGTVIGMVDLIAKYYRSRNGT